MMGVRFHGFSSVSEHGLYVNLFGGFPEYSEAILLQAESKILEFRNDVVHIQWTFLLGCNLTTADRLLRNQLQFKGKNREAIQEGIKYVLVLGHDSHSLHSRLRIQSDHTKTKASE
jgi:hypothetical protein